MSRIDTAAIRAWKPSVDKVALLIDYHHTVNTLCDALDAERERNAALVGALRGACDDVDSLRTELALLCRKHRIGRLRKMESEDEGMHNYSRRALLAAAPSNQEERGVD